MVSFTEAGLGTNQLIAYEASANASATYVCPKGQKQATAEVQYSDVSIADTTNNITQPISGVFTTGCLLRDVRGACS